MRKFSLSIAILLLSLLGSYGQTSQSKIALPNVVPVSPEAASLGKYGDLPVNLSTGRINYSIPIFTINEGGYQLPISLSYNHSGLLAEEDPGVVGLGWNLNAGGAIIRQLRGKPDETSGVGYIGGNIGKNYIRPYLTGTLSSSNKRTLFHGIEEGRIDSQPDRFVVNVGNLSGNFSYNEFGQALFVPQKNIRVTPKADSFDLIDASGIKYEFKAQEQTSSENIANNQTSSFIGYISSWGVTKIKIPQTSREINFQYTSGALYQKTGYSESQAKPIGFVGSSNVCTSVSQSIQRSTSITIINSTRQISKINFSQGSVLFDIRTVPSNSQSRNKNYLHGITIKDVNNKTINTYEFVYDNLLSNFKLLKQIKKFGSNGVEQPFYKFQYKGTPPLNINYSSQDHLGFYNGKNNTYLLNGNRNYNFGFSSLGALTKIIYPTGGNSEITYESNKVPAGDLQTCLLPKTNKKVSINLTSASYNGPIRKTIAIKQDQKIIVTLRTRADVGSGTANLANIVNAYASISGSSLDCAPSEPCGILDCRKSISTIMENGVQLNGGSKSVRAIFSAKANTTLTIEGTLEGVGTGLSYISVSYYDPNIPDPNPSNINTVSVGGIRVATTRDCTDGNCITKSYKYINEDGKSSGKALFTPVYKSIDSYVGVGVNCRFTRKTAQSRIPLSSFQGAPVFYSRVEVHLGTNSIGGKEVNEYTYTFNTVANDPFVSKNNKDWKKGNLKRKWVYRKDNTSFTLVKKIENTYTISYPFAVGIYNKYATSFLVKRNRFTYSPSLASGSQALLPLVGNPDTDYAEDHYDDRPEFYHLTQTKTTDYSNGEKMISTTSYSYNTPTGLLKEQSTTNSKGEVLKAVNSYPTSGTLVTQNRIAEPIETETLKGSTRLSKQKTLYKDFGNGLYLPQKVQTSKNTQNLEDRIVYHSYDTKGNPKEVSKADGTKIYYVWGYQSTQPIAKIEGYTNITTAQLSAINAAISESNKDKDTATENALRSKLTLLRNAFTSTTAQVTTFTYDPLIGVTSITDPRGYVMYYQYDSFNRLEFIKDASGNIVQENKYKYKN